MTKYLFFYTFYLKKVVQKLFDPKRQDNVINLFVDSATFEKFNNNHFFLMEIDFFLLTKIALESNPSR